MRRLKFITLLITGAFLGLCLTTTSCKGSAGKKVASEAMQLLEKEAGSIERNAGRIEKAAVGVEESSGKLSREAEDELNSYSKYRKAKKWEERIENTFGADEEVETTPQPVATTCSYCQGNRMVYATDAYGNVVFDYNGNPQVAYCPQCGGNGVVVTYQ